MDWICRWCIDTDGFTHGVVWSKQLWSNPFCWKPWFPPWLIMNARFVQSVATVLSLLVPVESEIHGNLISFSCSFFYFDPGLCWTCSPSQLYMKIYLKIQEKKNPLKLFCAIKVICRFFFYVRFFLDVKLLKIWYVVLNNLWSFLNR